MTPAAMAPLRGWHWIAEAFALFTRAPLPWLVMNLVLMGIGWLLGKVPVAGGYVLYLLAPIFLGGIMHACRQLDGGGKAEAGDLFRGFRQNTYPLIALGVVHLAGQMVISGVMLNLAGPEFQGVMRGEIPMDDPSVATPQVQGRALTALLVALALYVPLAMSLWFSPSLVMLGGQPGWRALKLSIQACLRNLAPLLVYGAASTILLLLALLPYGAGLVLWIPVMGLTMYTSYRDVFGKAALSGR